MRRLTLALLMTVAAAPALAQRADENATTQANDAFGTSVGNERVGIYSPEFVRGFSPIDAGNVRIEGLYFDQQVSPTGRLVEGTTVRVGLSAQSYPFPAPTGIADHSLRKAGDEAVFSPVVAYGPFGGWFAEFDAQLPIVEGKLGLAAGAGLYREELYHGGDPHFFSTAATLRWRPSDAVEIVPFWSRVRYSDDEPQMLLFTAGDYLPPKVPRRRYYGQDWTTNKGENINYGVLGRADLGGWTLRAGLFRSLVDQEQAFANLFTDVRPDGRAREIVIAFPDSKFASTSGELRLSRGFDEGDRRHTVHLMVRGREQRRRYGGEDVIDLGATTIGIPDPAPRPSFDFGPQNIDRVEQKTAGAGYELRWREVGEFSVGVQKTDYRKSVETPSGPLPTSKDTPWLATATAAAYLTDSLVAYAGYARGLEESPRAPEKAANRSVAPPAIRTKQLDAGLRWAPTPSLKLVAGVFEVSKPYYDLDPQDMFTKLGTVRHRGVELSLAGSPIAGLNIVAGTVFLDARVSGEAVDLGLIGKKPLTSIERNSFAAIDYRLPDSPFSIDATLESTGDRVANSENTLEVPPRAVLALGGRYRFKIGDKQATLRAQVSNIFNNYGFGVGGGGLLVYNLPRRFQINLAADL